MSVKKTLQTTHSSLDGQRTNTHRKVDKLFYFPSVQRLVLLSKQIPAVVGSAIEMTNYPFDPCSIKMQLIMLIIIFTLNCHMHYCRMY